MTAKPDGAKRDRLYQGYRVSASRGAKVEDLTLEGGAPVCMQGGGEYQRKLVCLVLGVSSHVQTTPQAWAGPEAWTQASVPPGDVS